ncbi:class II aldolase/adducin family protein [Nanoarchaeota archaeon]
MKELEKLGMICDEIGDNIELTQGTGGNLSVKTPEGMFIKASGVTVSEMMPRNAMVLLDHEMVAGMHANVEDEETARKHVQTSIIEAGEFKPSIETHFHSYLPKYVVHTHPLFTNVMLCSKSCKKQLKKAYPDLAYALIPYQRPGFYLSKEIFKAYGGGSPAIFFLQNHGLIVASDDHEEAVKITQEINNKARWSELQMKTKSFSPGNMLITCSITVMPSTSKSILGIL